MSALMPHTAYAEDQPYAKSILYYHTLLRGAQAGAIIGWGVGEARAFVLPVVRRTATLRSALALSSINAALPAVARSTGTGTIIGTAAMIPLTALRMWGREDIEWKDRSWRLLENKGQVEVDTWGLAGEGVGLATAIASRDFSAPGAWNATRLVVGKAGMGGVAGIVGYMIWRHGVHGGKFD